MNFILSASVMMLGSDLAAAFAEQRSVNRNLQDQMVL